MLYAEGVMKLLKLHDNVTFAANTAGETGGAVSFPTQGPSTPQSKVIFG